MNYKIKSLLYLICFIATALVYDYLSKDADTQKEVLAIDETRPDAEIITATDYQY